MLTPRPESRGCSYPCRRCPGGGALACPRYAFVIDRVSHADEGKVQIVLLAIAFVSRSTGSQ